MQDEEDRKPRVVSSARKTVDDAADSLRQKQVIEGKKPVDRSSASSS